MIVDVNAWTGGWPFAVHAGFTAAQLDRHLQAAGISRALTSPVEAILAADPGPANRALLRQAARRPRLLPAPVINPGLGNWGDLLEEYAAAGVRAVRLVPNYHGYSLADPSIRAALARIAGRRILPVVQMRVEDERAHHPLFRVPAVPVADVIGLARALPRLRLAVSCAYFAEAAALGRRTGNVAVDIAFVEKLDTVPCLLAAVPAGRVLFGSHTPFLYTRSAVMKARAAGIAPADRDRILHRNAAALLRLPGTRPRR
ncbi:MAG: amidohydrolase family protein [Planctomycetota bacterium]